MSNIISLIQSNLVTIIIFIFVFGILIFIHEFGHFISARMIKADVEEFAFGMGPNIWKKKLKNLVLKLNLFPIGGYVKVKGEDKIEESNDKGDLRNKTVLQRMFVMLSGVILNLFLAISLYYILFFVAGYKINFTWEYKDFNPLFAQVTVEKLSDLKYISITEDGAAKEAGMPDNGLITKINDKTLQYSAELVDELIVNKGKGVQIEVCNQFCNTYYPTVSEEGKLGISLKQNYSVYLDYSNNKATAGFAHAINIIRVSVVAMSEIFSSAKETGDYTMAINTVSGPVGIYVVIDALKEYGTLSILSFLADLSLVLGVTNLLPIPVLDGGRVVMLLPELIFRKPINRKLENALINITYIFLLLLMVGVVVKDFVYIDLLRSLLK